MVEAEVIKKVTEALEQKEVDNSWKIYLKS
jgi:hypothetical protein